ncbi:uncharacterized protein H6S33_010446 [Morchella sextelata]|uniref:uncharacterized protein n=1 Tax=Morchella sextelata TaxID=1174677 RepID=UPI001D04B212|nr:uncharacterized protein H6S33_010446 [Morchella sextelata]KAH0612394.1 hypothetical protein H6S33_010446 [Morchella sextelata]
MGGSAFSASKYGGNLPTPRIPMHIYPRLLIQFQQTLSQFYKNVSSPLPAPGKTDYGDIDILVEEPLSQTPVSAAELKHALNATEFIEASPTSNFAIWDDELKAYVQLDVHICRRGGLEWECFHHAYGDLWNILGVMGKPFGVSVNNAGLHIFAQGIEARNHKDEMIFLTARPKHAIEFFGCDWAKYEKGFKTADELFSFCAESRLLYHPETNWKLIGRRDEGRLKEKRLLCRRWSTEYLPSYKSRNEMKVVITREELLEDALIKFDKRGVYNALIDKWDKEEFDKKMWTRIAEVLPVKDTELALVLRPLKARLKKEDTASSVQGLSGGAKLHREIKWTAIALSEWETLLEGGLAKSTKLREEGLNKRQGKK